MAAADPANPQSWNRYAYVANNPLSFIDPSGRQGGPSMHLCYSHDGFSMQWPTAGPCNISPHNSGGNLAFAGGFGDPFSLQQIPVREWSCQYGDCGYYVVGMVTLRLSRFDLGAANNGGIWGDIKNWFHTAKLVGVGGSFWIAHPAVPVGWSPGANFVSDGK